MVLILVVKENEESQNLTKRIQKVQFSNFVIDWQTPKRINTSDKHNIIDSTNERTNNNVKGLIMGNLIHANFGNSCLNV